MFTDSPRQLGETPTTRRAGRPILQPMCSSSSLRRASTLRKVSILRSPVAALCFQLWANTTISKSFSAASAFELVDDGPHLLAAPYLALVVEFDEAEEIAHTVGCSQLLQAVRLAEYGKARRGVVTKPIVGSAVLRERRAGGHRHNRSAGGLRT